LESGYVRIWKLDFVKWDNMFWFWIIVKLIIGIGILGWSADRFIRYSTVIADRTGMPPLIIGVLLVGFGTSFPELVVSVIAAIQHKSGIAVGNAIGSNIANIGLVAGLTALISPLAIHSQFLKREFPLIFILTAITGFLIWDGDVSRIDGAILLIILALYIYWMLFLMPKQMGDEDTLSANVSSEVKTYTKPFWHAIVGWFVALAALLVSSDLLLSASVAIAKWFELSDFIIGLTVVAIGTSLPELAATIMSVKKGEDDLAMGNIMGSSIFNLLGVVGLPSIISPSVINVLQIRRDYLVMTGFFILLFIFSFFTTKTKSISRSEGAVLLVCFIGYLSYLLLG